MSAPLTRRECAMLAAIRDLLDVPMPAIDVDTYTETVKERAFLLVGALMDVENLSGVAGCTPEMITAIARKFAARPLSYMPDPERVRA